MKGAGLTYAKFRPFLSAQNAIHTIRTYNISDIVMIYTKARGTAMLASDSC